VGAVGVVILPLDVYLAQEGPFGSHPELDPVPLAFHCRLPHHSVVHRAVQGLGHQLGVGGRCESDGEDEGGGEKGGEQKMHLKW